MKLKKILTFLHLWIGIVSGVIVFILGLTGCVLVFVDEIKPIVYSDRFEVTSILKTQVSPHDMMQKVQDIWGRDKPVSTLEIQNNPNNAWHFRAFQDDSNEGIWYWNEKKYYESLFMDPYTGKLVFHEQSEFEFFRIILYLHWSLLLKSDLGQPIVGVATILYVLLLITGLYLWWPKNKKARRVRFAFRWKEDTGIKRKNYDLHNILGFYSLSLGMIIALTGLVFAFSWFNRGVQKLFNVDSAVTQNSSISPVYPLPNISNSKPLDYIFNDFKKRYPEAKGYLFYFPRDSSSTISILARYESTHQAVTARYNAVSGQLLQVDTNEGKNARRKFRSINYGIHTGSILGLSGKILAFLASLISASLPVTGFLIWYNKKWGKKHTRNKHFLSK